MTARRRLLVTGRTCLVVAAVAALSACERPTPIVTVVSGTTSEWKEADRWCFDADTCVEGEGPLELEVAPGQPIGIDVSRDVVEKGWYFELSVPGTDQSAQSGLQLDKHYFRLDQGVGPNGLRLVVKAIGDDGPNGEAAGEWTFDLVAPE